MYSTDKSQLAEQQQANPRGFTVVEFVVVLAIIAILISLLLPAILHARDAARRTHCQNNLKQIVLAIHNYSLKYKVFPPGVVNDEGPIRNLPDGYHHNWIVQILPELDGAQVTTLMDFTSSVYAHRNSQFLRVRVPSLTCPSNLAPDGTVMQHSSYAACHNDREAPIDSDNVGVFTLNSSTRTESITDGMSHTIFLGEVRLPSPEVFVHRTERGAAGLLGWSSGTRSTLRNVSEFNLPDTWNQKFDINNPTYVGGFGSYHDGGAYFGWGDGSVRYLRDTVDPMLLRKFAHPADGELLTPPRPPRRQP